MYGLKRQLNHCSDTGNVILQSSVHKTLDFTFTRRLKLPPGPKIAAAGGYVPGSEITSTIIWNLTDGRNHVTFSTKLHFLFVLVFTLSRVCLRETQICADGLSFY